MSVKMSLLINITATTEQPKMPEHQRAILTSIFIRIY